MFTSLDWLIIVVMAMAAASLLALALMFLVRRDAVRRACFYIVAAMGVYMGYVGFRILWRTVFPLAVLAILLALVSVGAVVVERTAKGDAKRFNIARMMAAGALVLGFVNAFS